MTKEELWLSFAKDNEAFCGDDRECVDLQVGGIKELFSETWDHAYEQGVARGRAIAEGEAMTHCNPTVDALSEMFGFKK